MLDYPSMLPAIVFVPFAAAMLALLIGRYTGRHTGLLMVLAALTCFGMSTTLFLNTHQAGQAPALFTTTWFSVGTFQIDLRLLGDAFGLFFAMLVSGIGTLVGIYSLSYIPTDLPNSRLGRYYAALITFMGAMLGVALADNLMLLYVFWEITTIASFMLIGFWYDEASAKRGANMAMQVTVTGGLGLLAGVVLIGVAAGTFTLSELQQQTGAWSRLLASPLANIALILVFLGAFTKSAQAPFHFWLPNAMVAPTPVSTYLHAATMVKAGIFLVGRMLPIFGGTALWSPVLITVGLITFVLGAYQAMRETDLKAILARTTLSMLGMIMLVYGLNASEQDALQILSHATYKGALFLVAGIVEHATHTRDIRELGGLRRKMPITFIICAAAALSMAGVPPFFGFLAKEALYHELLHSEVLHAAGVGQWLVVAGSVLANAFMFAVSFKILLGVFCGPETEKGHHAHEAGPGLWIPPAVLALAATGLGVIGVTSVTEHLVQAISSDPHSHVHISMNPVHWSIGPVVLTFITIALGVGFYMRRTAVEAAQARLDVLPSAPRVWERMMEHIAGFATFYAGRWQNGSLHWYIAATMAFFIGVSAYALVHGGLSLANATVDLTELPWYAIALGVLTIGAMTAVVRANTRMGGAIALGATGFLVSLMFVVYRSPDILLTQILIETVSTIFILLILFFMPSFQPEQMSITRKMINLGISAGVGIIVFLMVLLSMSDGIRATRTLKEDYLSRALDGAGGANAVNVIIVDFRAIDTTGEICVLVIVGLAVFALLRSRRKLA